jgi:hypothetical protein
MSPSLSVTLDAARRKRLFFRFSSRAPIISARLGESLERSLHNFIESKIRTEIDNGIGLVMI